MTVKMLALQSCLTLCNPMDCSPPGSTVYGISQARILKWVAISFSRGSSQPRDGTHVSCIVRWVFFFTTGPLGKHCEFTAAAAKSLQSCLTLCNPMECNLSDSSVHGISQGRILEWVAISFARGSFQPRDQIHISCIAGRFLTAEPPGKPLNRHTTIYKINRRGLLYSTGNPLNTL